MKNCIMRCGHASSGLYEGKPVCVVCAPDPRAFEIDENIPNLEGREAKCNECGLIVKSRLDLPFFEYRPDKNYDSFYSGCRGWD